MQNKIKLKEKIYSGTCVLGTWCEIPSPAAVNVIAKAGLDFIILDREHGSLSFTETEQLIMAAAADNCEVIIRVSKNEESEILRTVDRDPAGIMIPHIDSAAQIAEAVRYSKFPPNGMRGFNPYIRAGGYNNNAGYFDKKNAELIMAVIIEGKSALSNIASLVSIPEIDVFYLGAYDLSVSLGVPGNVSHPLVQKAIADSVNIIRKNDKIAGCMFHDENDLRIYKEMGIQFLVYKADTGLLYNIYNTMKRNFQND